MQLPVPFLLITLSLLAPHAGCVAWRQPTPLQEPSWANRFRERSSDTSSFGVDPRARDIERNLGVGP